MKNKRNAIYAVISVVLLLSPAFLNAYWVDVLNNIGLYTILALSLNIILGHAGLFHMGHAAFYAHLPYADLRGLHGRDDDFSDGRHSPALTAPIPHR